MSYKLPSDFNADRYGATNPDVALSPLSSRAHYRRFGRLLGRSPQGFVFDPPATQANGDDAEQTGGRSFPIIDRPAGFDPLAAVPMSASPKQADDRAHTVSLETLQRGPFLPSENQERLCLPLAAYAGMFSMSGLRSRPRCDEAEICGGNKFRSGATRIDSAFVRKGSRLRLMIGGGTEGLSASKGWTLRAYQAAPSNPGRLSAATGDGVQLPAVGPVFHDIRLVHPLMPVILEMSDEDGFTQEMALLPFPSLLPGGMHGAELTALQDQANPMDAFWSLSDLLLHELLGGVDWPKRSIESLSIGQESAAETEPVLSLDIKDWLAAVFGLAVEKGQDAVKTNGDGLGLFLPADCIPTLSALVSRRLDVGNVAQLAGPFLVANPASLQPRWSIVIPPETELAEGVPILVTGRPDTSRGKPGPLPVHLAIALRSPQHRARAVALATAKPDGDAPIAAEPLGLTVLVEASDPARAEAVIRDLTGASGGSDMELFVRLSHSDGALREAVERSCGNRKWITVERDLDLRELARNAQYDLLVTANDLVSLHNRNVVHVLCGLVRHQPNIGSASCVLLSETIINDQTVWETATGGLFPARVSFAGSPRLTFAEPDVIEALPDLTYDVVANTLFLTVWDRAALARLPKLGRSVPHAARDIKLGLDLMEAGYRNLCTTRVSAGLCEPVERQETIDPFGSTYVQPGRWDDILRRVTVLRELH